LDATTQLTSPSTIIGTPQFMAPEQLEGSNADAAMDMWALGVTLYAAVQGRPPFSGPTIPAVIAAIVGQPTSPPDHAGPLTGLLLALLAKDPAARPDAQTVARELAALRSAPATGGSGTVSMPPATGPALTAAAGPASPAGPAIPGGAGGMTARTAALHQPSPGGPPRGPGAGHRPGASHRQAAPAPGGRGRSRRRPLIAGAAAVVVALAGVGVYLATRPSAAGHPGAPGSSSAAGTFAASPAASHASSGTATLAANGPPACAKGSLGLVGSSAFLSIAKAAAEAYMHDCPGATVAVTDGDSAYGLSQVQGKVASGAAAAGSTIAMYDGSPAASATAGLKQYPMGVLIYSVVAHSGLFPGSNVTSADLSKLFVTPGVPGKVAVGRLGGSGSRRSSARTRASPAVPARPQPGTRFPSRAAPKAARRAYSTS
jgi:hypothetical protein